MGMHMWQLCHLAMVVPIADAYYEADCPERAGKDWKIMKKTAKKLKRNFSFLRKQAGRLSPCKMNIFRFFCFFKEPPCLIIPVECVLSFGGDVILVNIEM